MSQSSLLSDFYRDYLAWVDSGAPEHPVFDRNSGLCLQLDMYVSYVDIEVYANDFESQLVEAGLCEAFPFNGGYKYGDTTALKDYTNECRSHACHLNEARIQWVRDHC